MIFDVAAFGSRHPGVTMTMNTSGTLLVEGAIPSGISDSGGHECRRLCPSDRREKSYAHKTSARVHQKSYGVQEVGLFYQGQVRNPLTQPSPAPPQYPPPGHLIQQGTSGEQEGHEVLTPTEEAPYDIDMSGKPASSSAVQQEAVHDISVRSASEQILNTRSCVNNPTDSMYVLIDERTNQPVVCARDPLDEDFAESQGW